MKSTWLVRGVSHDLSTRGMIMGIVNVTPDSFSDGGHFVESESAVKHGIRLFEEGAAILDIGGESTRPGADPVPTLAELDRVIPVIKALRAQVRAALISVDTMKGDVAKAAYDAGVDIINDVNGLRDPAMLDAVAACDVGVVVMHMKGEPRTMQAKPVYTDVVVEVRDFFEERLATLEQAGISPERVAFDPGFGFGKTLEHNLALLRALPDLRVGNRPIVVGVSRKSMIASLLGTKEMISRDAPTVALTAWMRDLGAEIIRVHDVKPNAEAMRMMEAILLR